LEQEAVFSLGRSTEISRDEVKFQKFIDRLRRRFSMLFLGILKKQLVLKGIITDQDWEDWKSDIAIDFIKDNHYAELKEAEILQNRIAILGEVSQFAGDYFSKQWIWKNVLRLSDEDIAEMKKEIDKDIASGDLPDPEEEEEKEREAAARPPAPTPVTVVPNTTADKEQKLEKDAERKRKERAQEKYVPSHEDELLEEMTRYMAKVNEQD